MYTKSFLFILYLSAIGTYASPFQDMLERAVGDTCKSPKGTGACKHTKDCTGISYPTNLCPKDPSDVQCCVDVSCKVDSTPGHCRSVKNNGCNGGSFHTGYCPGDSDIQCCIKPSASDPPPSSSSLGEKILAQAKKAEGAPYKWGGGSCKASPKSSFDCSGLVSWAICQVTGRDLFDEELRVTRSMYCASESKLKYSKIPYSQRKAGDAVFFGGACDCKNNPKGIHHVGLMMGSGTVMWNALEKKTKVRSDDFGGWSDKACPLYRNAVMKRD